MANKKDDISALFDEGSDKYHESLQSKKESDKVDNNEISDLFEKGSRETELASDSAKAAPEISKTESAIRGAGKGVTFGTQPVLAGAGAGAMQALTGDFGPKGGRSLESIYNAYKQMKDQEIQKNRAAQEANPLTFGASELVGSIPTAVAAGAAGLTGLKGAATVGGAAGLGGYVGDTEDPSLKGAAISTGIGAAGGAALHGAAKLAGKLIPQSVKEGFSAGQEGVNVLSKEAQQKILPEEGSKASDFLSKKVLKANGELRQDVDKVLNDATSQGTTVSIENPFGKAVNDLDKLLTSDSSYGDASTESGKYAHKLFSKIKQYKVAAEEAPDSVLANAENAPEGLVMPEEQAIESGYKLNLTPLETRNLANEVGEYASDLAGAKEPRLAKIAYEFSKSLKDSLRTGVPQYANAADRVTQFQRYLPETIMSRGENPELSGVRLSDSKNQYMDIKDPTEDMISDLAKKGISTDEAKRTFNRLDESLDQLMDLEKNRADVANKAGEPFQSVFDKMGMNKKEIMEYLQKKAQRTAAYDYMKTGSIPLKTPKSVTQTLTDMAGKTGVAVGNIGGRLVGGLIYNAPKEVLYAAADKLSKSPEVAHLGVGLKTAVSSGDVIKRNAAIFAILQNPAAKNILDPNLEEDNKNDNKESKGKYNTYSY